MELKLDTGCVGRKRTYLLIVPYGIETNLKDPGDSQPDPFNRTLWN